MTPTEQAADRVNDDWIRVLAEKALEEHAQECRENPGNDQWEPVCEIDPEDLLQLLSDKQALQARAEEAEKARDQLKGFLAWLAKQRRAASAEFVCALMAAAAETNYRTGFRDAERVTDERHIDYLRGNTIAGIAAAMQAPDADLTARVETLQARVEELEGALKPLLSCLDDIETYQRRPERGDWGVECAWPHKAEAVPTRTPQVSHEFREAKQNNPSPTTGADQ